MEQFYDSSVSLLYWCHLGPFIFVSVSIVKEVSRPRFEPPSLQPQSSILPLLYWAIDGYHWKSMNQVLDSFALSWVVFCLRNTRLNTRLNTHLNLNLGGYSRFRCHGRLPLCFDVSYFCTQSSYKTSGASCIYYHGIMCSLSLGQMRSWMTSWQLGFKHGCLHCC